MWEFVANLVASKKVVFIIAQLEPPKFFLSQYFELG